VDAADENYQPIRLVDVCCYTGAAGIPAQTWVKASLPLDAIDVQQRIVQNISIMNYSDAVIPLAIDEIRLVVQIGHC